MTEIKKFPGSDVEKESHSTDAFRYGTNWISVKMHKPNPDDIVLCYSDEEGFYVTQYVKLPASYEPGYFESWRYGRCPNCPGEEPTHWMPLPKPPNDPCPESKNEKVAYTCM